MFVIYHRVGQGQKRRRKNQIIEHKKQDKIINKPPKHHNPPLKKKANHNCIAFIIYYMYNSLFNSYSFRYYILPICTSVLILMNFLLKNIFKFYLTLPKNFNGHSEHRFTFENRCYYCDMGKHWNMNTVIFFSLLNHSS